jgi:hypothetical protein
MKVYGGAGSVSILTSSPRPYGRKRARFDRLLSCRTAISQRLRERRRRTQHPICGHPMAPEIAKRSQLFRLALNDHL